MLRIFCRKYVFRSKSIQGKFAPNVFTIMKYFTLLLFYLLFITCGFAQVGINTTSPDASSALDISSTDKGILIPRMTEIQRTAIVLPATGLLVYQTNGEEGFWYYNGTSWTSLKGGEFKSTSGIVHNTTNTAVDDFVFGATQLDQDGNPDHYNKFFFNKEKAAFRAGQVGDNAWNNVNTGICSVAMGFNNLASGLGSTSFGVGNQASGGIATAIGEYSQATGYSSIALGANLIVSGNYAIGIGNDNDATNTNSIAIGNYSTANGEGAFAIGNNSLASGYYSTAIGSANISSGNLSIALGNSNTALSFGEMTLGLNATNYVPLSTTSFNSSDRLLSVGNGVNTSNRSNALTILKNGNVGIGVENPEATLDLVGTLKFQDGNQAVGKVLVSDADGNATWEVVSNFGEFQSIAGVVQNTTNTANDDFVFGSSALGNIAGTGDDRRMFFDKSKGAFRAGSVFSDQWDDGNVGNFSVAIGFNPIASGVFSNALGIGAKALGDRSTAIGEGSIASGQSATAFGAFTNASGFFSTAMGRYTNALGAFSTTFGETTTASGNCSTAMGRNSVASGGNSIALGLSTQASSFCETALGLNNLVFTSLSTTSFDANDVLLSVGNGVNTSNRSNALTILKNGNSALGNHTPTARMDIEGAALGVIPLQLRGGNNNDVYNFNQVTFGWNNDDSYRHNIRTRHNGVGDEGNSIDFFVWDYGTDSSETIGTKHVMTIDGIGNGALGIATTAPNYTLEVNGDAAKPGGGTFIATSDSRLKQNINPYTKGLDEVLLINPVTYQYNKQSGFDTKPVYTGVIAQELKEIAPEMVGTFTKDNTEYYNVDTSALTFMLVNSIKKLSEENNAVKSTNEVLQKQLNLLERKNEELEKQYREMTIRLEKIEDLLSD